MSTNIKTKPARPIHDVDSMITAELHNAFKNADPDSCPDCGSMTHTEVEWRDGYYYELVRYCEGCGATQT